MIRSLDKPLFYTTAILFVGGLLILASASIVLSQQKFGSIGGYAWRQLVSGGLVGVIAFWIGLRVPYRAWKKFSLPLMIFSFVLLAMLFLPQFSYSFGGARRWLQFGPINFQPSEILKLTFVMYLASWLDARRSEMASISYGLVPFSVMLGVIGIFLIMQPDFGTLGVIVITAGILYFLGGGKTNQIISLAFLGLAAAYLVVKSAPYRFSRILVFLNPGFEPQGRGYQVSQALIALGSGGFKGLGFGRSLQKYNYLPEPMGDSIFAIYGEEMGFLGVLLLIGLFVVFLWRGLLIARRAPDIFGKLLAAGIVISVVVQAFVNMAAISGLLPLTGIPLPFVSYGGSSLVVTLAGIGILLNISKHSHL